MHNDNQCLIRESYVKLNGVFEEHVNHKISNRGQTRILCLEMCVYYKVCYCVPTYSFCVTIYAPFCRFVQSLLKQTCMSVRVHVSDNIQKHLSPYQSIKAHLM